MAGVGLASLPADTCCPFMPPCLRSQPAAQDLQAPHHPPQARSTLHPCRHRPQAYHSPDHPPCMCCPCRPQARRHSPHHPPHTPSSPCRPQARRRHSPDHPPHARTGTCRTGTCAAPLCTPRSQACRRCHPHRYHCQRRHPCAAAALCAPGRKISGRLRPVPCIQVGSC
jgi:hypothetical protein